MRRLAIVAVFALLAALSTALVGCASGAESQRAENPEPRPTVRVKRVIDGDTVVLTRFGRTRLIGIDTPEEGKCYENAATRFTRRRLEGKRVGYELGVEREDRYGRTLAYLYRDGMHNLALVENGLATALTIPPNDKYAARFIEAEENARQVEEGRWSGECQRKRRQARARARARARERELARERALERRLRAERRRRREAERRAEQSRSSDDSGDSGGSSAAPSGDIDCSEVDGPIPTPPGDPNNLDGDGDGQACE